MTRNRLDDPAIAAALARLNAGASHPWTQADGELQKTFKFKDFSAAFGFMARVALAAERLDHHPDWCNVYREVRVSLTTHDAGGLTELDFALAEQMEAIAR